MKIEVGKRYRTRDGRVATVERIDRDKEPDNSAAMSADVDGKVQFYCANGRYYSGSLDHDFDLVEELPDEPVNGYNDREELIGTIRDLGAALRVLLYQVENRNAPAFGFPLEDAARLARVTLERHSP